MTSSEMSSDDVPAGELPRRLGLVSATALVVGEVVGVGIFLTPAEMAKALGSPFWLLIAWATMGLIAICGALCFGTLAASYPEDGGGYVYLRRAFGPRIAFLYGWMSLLVTDPGLTAMLAAGLATYVNSLFGLSPLGLKLVGVVAIAAVALVNILGIGVGAGIMRALSGLKLAVLAAIVVWGFGLGLGSWSNFQPFIARPPGSEPLPQALVGGMLAAFFSLAGWWDVSKIAGEVRDPTRTMPRALLLGVGIVTLVYILISAVFWYLVPLSLVDPHRGFAAQAGEALFGRAGERIFASIVILSVLGSLVGIIMAAPRVYYAIARDRLFPSGLAAVHPRFGTPARATAIQAIVASVLVMSGSFEQILSYFMAVTIAFLALMVVAVFFLPAEPGTPRVPGYPLTPLGFIVPVVLIVVLQLSQGPVRSGIGFGIVALGVPIYEIFFRAAARTAATKDQSESPPPEPRVADLAD